MPEAGKSPEYGFTWKVSERGRMAWFLDQNGLHGGGMATALWQSAPGTVAASLEGRPRRTCRNSLLLALEPATGSGIASAAVKILHKVLPPLRITRFDISKKHMRGRHALGPVIRGRSSNLTPWNRPHSLPEPICRFPEHKLFSPIPVTTAYRPQYVIMSPIPPAVPQKPDRACSLSSCQRCVLPGLVLPHRCLP